MRLLRIFGFVFITALLALGLASCSGGGSGSAIAPPMNTTPVTPPSGPSASGQQRKVQEIAIPSGVPSGAIAAGSDGSVYVGNGSGLYRYLNGTFTFTQPAIPQGYFEFGGESLVSAAAHTVVWTENVYEGGSIEIQGQMECGGNGGTAALCDPSKFASVTNTISFIVDSHGTSWAGGNNATAGGAQVGAANVGLFFVPPQYQNAMELTLGPDGNVWGGNVQGSASGPSAFFQFALVNGQIQNTKLVPLPAGDEINGLTLGPDGRFWFTDGANNAIGAMTISGTVTEYPIPTAKSLPNQITVGADGALWFTETQANQIGRIDVTGHITEYAVPSPNAQLYGIAATPTACGNPAIWFSEPGAKKIGEISLAP
jgi:streptogramin lyase